MREKIEIVFALSRVVLLNLDLAYYWLPRSWRGGYVSPWERDS